ITDMKSGLAAGVVAMLRLKQHEASLNGTFKLFATVGEELGELGAEQMVRLGLANDIDALLVGEPSGVPVEFVSKLPKEASLPGIMLSENIHEVVAKNSINEQHFLTIAHKGALTYKVKSQGITAHSSMPELGVNAIDTLVNFINQQSQVFQKIERIKNDILGATTPVVTEISGGEQPNTVPGSAEVSVFIRTIPEVTHEEILSQISRIIDDINANSHAKLTLETDISLEAVYSQKESKLNRLAKLIGERVLQQSLPFIGVSGGTDASQFVKVNPNLDFLVFGPGNISAHQVDEFVYTNIYHSFIDIYEEIIRDYLK
ncbi:MAG: M20/M25/M40 family metallo-hydrolase, partial [Thomasclavelia spiroformis]